MRAVIAGLLISVAVHVPTMVSADSHRCDQYRSVALQAGWSDADWPRLSQIMWRESRCQPWVHNRRGRDDSYGLMQLNMRAHSRWVRPLVAGDFTQLFDPLTNLTVARHLFERADDAYGCGWQPWTTRRTRGWCS
ncbi:MAG: hypothetical protein EBZ69_07860 [Alphaproteobacteria bacterium]|nr:hypothetical protein [Alphaproteobacteria bacterium]